MADSSTYPAVLDGELDDVVPEATAPTEFKDYLKLLGDAISRIEVTLGVNPQGDEDDVVARLAPLQGQNVHAANFIATDEVGGFTSGSGGSWFGLDDNGPGGTDAHCRIRAVEDRPALGLQGMSFGQTANIFEVTLSGDPTLLVYIDADGDLHAAGEIHADTFHGTVVGQAENIRFVVDGGGSAIATGAKKVYLRVPYDCTVTGWQILADQSGSITFDLWKDSYANFPPTDADSMVAAAPPVLTTATKATSTTLTGWDTSLTEGEIIELNVDSATTVTKVILDLFVERA